MSEPKPIVQAMQVFEELLDELEKYQKAISRPRHCSAPSGKRSN